MYFLCGNWLLRERKRTLQDQLRAMPGLPITSARLSWLKQSEDLPRHKELEKDSTSGLRWRTRSHCRRAGGMGEIVMTIFGKIICHNMRKGSIYICQEKRHFSSTEPVR